MQRLAASTSFWQNISADLARGGMASWMAIGNRGTSGADSGSPNAELLFRRGWNLALGRSKRRLPEKNCASETALPQDQELGCDKL
jgi:hypothetical protein